MTLFVLIGLLIAGSHMTSAARSWKTGENQANLDLNDKTIRNRINHAVLEPLENFGNVGRVLYEVATNDQALGDEFSKASAVLTRLVGQDNYQKSFNTALLLAQRIKMPERLEKLLDSARSVQDPKTGQTLGDALNVITNIFNDSNAVDEIIKNIRNQSTHSSSSSVDAHGIKAKRNQRRY